MYELLSGSKRREKKRRLRKLRAVGLFAGHSPRCGYSLFRDEIRSIAQVRRFVWQTWRKRERLSEVLMFDLNSSLTLLLHVSFWHVLSLGKKNTFIFSYRLIGVRCPTQSSKEYIYVHRMVHSIQKGRKTPIARRLVTRGFTLCVFISRNREGLIKKDALAFRVRRGA